MAKFETMKDIMFEIWMCLEIEAEPLGFKVDLEGASEQSCSRYFSIGNEFQVRVSDHPVGSSAISTPDFGINLGNWESADAHVAVSKTYGDMDSQGNWIALDEDGNDGFGNHVSDFPEHDGYEIDPIELVTTVKAAIAAANAEACEEC